MLPPLFFFTRSVFFLFYLGFSFKIWGVFDSGQILEMYVVYCFPFKNAVVSQSQQPVHLSRARLNEFF